MESKSDNHDSFDIQSFASDVDFQKYILDAVMKNRKKTSNGVSYFLDLRYFDMYGVVDTPKSENRYKARTRCRETSYFLHLKTDNKTSGNVKDFKTLEAQKQGSCGSRSSTFKNSTLIGEIGQTKHNKYHKCQLNSDGFANKDASDDKVITIKKSSKKTELMNNIEVTPNYPRVQESLFKKLCFNVERQDHVVYSIDEGLNSVSNNHQKLGERDLHKTTKCNAHGENKHLHYPHTQNQKCNDPINDANIEDSLLFGDIEQSKHTNLAKCPQKSVDFECKDFVKKTKDSIPDITYSDEHKQSQNRKNQPDLSFFRKCCQVEQRTLKELLELRRTPSFQTFLKSSEVPLDNDRLHKPKQCLEDENKPDLSSFRKCCHKEQKLLRKLLELRTAPTFQTFLKGNEVPLDNDQLYKPKQCIEDDGKCTNSITRNEPDLSHIRKCCHEENKLLMKLLEYRRSPTFETFFKSNDNHQIYKPKQCIEVENEPTCSKYLSSFRKCWHHEKMLLKELLQLRRNPTFQTFLKSKEVSFPNNHLYKPMHCIEDENKPACSKYLYSTYTNSITGNQPDLSYFRKFCHQENKLLMKILALRRTPTFETFFKSNEGALHNHQLYKPKQCIEDENKPTCSKHLFSK